ncbi:MAG: SCO family protein [Proteobacteria bacterium]|nr:SCO family protein [Pseudomonadota bacterium]MBI3498571.1 SCO family protein [Pseudomonadota bacterium]
MLKPMTGLRRALAMLGTAVLTAALASAAVAHNPATKSSAADAAGEIGGPFTLLDHNGRTVSDAQFRGRLMLIYFGYTNCPDICPLDAQNIAAAMDLLGSRAAGVQPLFITIDPERDTPERLADWLGPLHPRFLGLTGTPEQIAMVTKAYKVEFERMAPTAAGSYEFTFGHPGLLYLVDTDGHFLAMLPSGTEPEAIVAEVERYLPQKKPVAPARTDAAAPKEIGNLEIFKRADLSNLQRLDNGDFLFRLARDNDTGVTYWAYNGNTKNILAVAADARIARDDETAKNLLLTITKLPSRTACGVGAFHESSVWVVPETYRIGPKGPRLSITPVLVEGDVQNDKTGTTPPRLLRYRNHLSGR